MHAHRFHFFGKTAGSDEIEARKGGQLSITSIPKAPTGLTAPGRALWRSVLTHYWMDGESHKLAILEQA